jgi:putative nucleotide binding protein
MNIHGIVMREDYAIILDFLPLGYPGARHPEPIAQSIGTKYFSLLELVAKENVSIKAGEEVYIGQGERNKIKMIKRRLKLSELTGIASSNLEEILDELIKRNEKRFVEFFNTAGTITPRLHKLELLSGIGKKYVQNIISKRPFESFEDIEKKVGISNIVKIIKKRIMEELEGNEKYYIFVAPIKPRIF